ncbi:MAG: hypothetical protein AB1644_10195 [Candidatus Zixiibacteriota bacterium]
MANQDKQTPSGRQISQDERFHYIGFEVYPGKPKDLFRNDAEKTELVRKVEAKRAQGDLLRDECKLLEERVSGRERIVLSIAAALVFLSLFLPWYSAYKEIVEESAAPAATQAVTGEDTGQPKEEVITTARASRKTHREYAQLSGFGSLIAIGDVAGKMFSSGLSLMLTAVIMLAYTLLCVWLPFRALMGMWKSKKTGDDLALQLKYLLRLNWLPVILLALAFVVSFIGGDYGFSAKALYTSLGSSYGPGVFLGSLSWGMLVSLGGFLVLATKGIEI